MCCCCLLLADRVCCWPGLRRGETVQTGSAVCLFFLFFFLFLLPLPLLRCSLLHRRRRRCRSLLHFGSLLASHRFVMSSAPINNLKKTFGLTSEELADGRIATLEDIGRQSTHSHAHAERWTQRWGWPSTFQCKIGKVHGCGGSARGPDCPMMRPASERRGAPCPSRPHGLVCMQSYRNDARMLTCQCI